MIGRIKNDLRSCDVPTGEAELELGNVCKYHSTIVIRQIPIKPNLLESIDKTIAVKHNGKY